MDNKIEYKTNEKSDWLKAHTLTSEDFKKLISNKLERARVQSEANRKLNKVVG
jgi:hypothetical protein